MIKTLKAVGIEPGKDFDIAAVGRRTAKGLQRAMGTFGILQKAIKKLKTENGWIVIPENFADYGTDYKTRAGIALIGLGGIWRQDVLYPTAFKDGDGKPLDGANRYVLHFDRGPDAAHQGDLVGVDVRPAGLLRAERDRPLQPRRLDAAHVQRRRLAGHLHPGRVAGRGEGVELASRARERAVQPHGPDLLADGRGARRHLQASAGQSA